MRTENVGGKAKKSKYSRGGVKAFYEVIFQCFWLCDDAYQFCNPVLGGYRVFQ